MTPGAQFYLTAFWELNADRPIGMSAGPIPFSAIDAYARRFGVHGEDFAHFARMVRAMDETLLGRGDAPASPAKASGRPLSPALFDAVFG